MWWVPALRWTPPVSAAYIPPWGSLMIYLFGCGRDSKWSVSSTKRHFPDQSTLHLKPCNKEEWFSSGSTDFEKPCSSQRLHNATFMSAQLEKDLIVCYAYLIKRKIIVWVDLKTLSNISKVDFLTWGTRDQKPSDALEGENVQILFPIDGIGTVEVWKFLETMWSD